MDNRPRVLGYVIAAVVVLALIGWLSWRYAVKRGYIRSLGSTDMVERVEAARWLLEREKLEDSLPAQPIIVRSKTAQALGEIDDPELAPEAIRVLGVILKDQEEAPRRWARQALVKHGEQAVSELMRALTATGGTLDETIAALEKIGPEAAPQMRMLLSDRSSYKGASTALAKMGTQGVAPLLVATYAIDASVRERALSDLSGEKVRAALQPALDNLDAKLSPGAGISALGLLGDRVATEPVIKFLTDKDNRVGAATALGLIGDARAVEPILATMTETEKRYRAAGIVALRRIVRKSGAGAFGPLVRELKSPDPLMRQAAAAALEAASSPALDPVLEAALQDSDSHVRASAARALGWKGNVNAVAPLVGALGDTDWRVVGASVQALAAIGTGAIPQLTAIIGRGTGEAQTTLNYQISLALADMGRDAVPHLVAALSSPNPEVATWSAVALGEVRDPGAAAELEKAVEKLKELEQTASGDLKWVVQEQLRVMAAATDS